MARRWQYRLGDYRQGTQANCDAACSGAGIHHSFGSDTHTAATHIEQAFTLFD